jgi:hypothetical protein
MDIGVVVAVVIILRLEIEELFSFLLSLDTFFFIWALSKLGSDGGLLGICYSHTHSLSS